GAWREPFTTVVIDYW
nr:immunoglobulin heavy chain junction region [Mus musculus]